MYLTIGYGNDGWLASFNTSLAAWPLTTWVAVLLVYSYLASVLPVWMLLQPRDFINSLQLLSALALVVVGILVAATMGGAPVGDVRPPLELAAPAYNASAPGAPLLFPFLFITIACGAVSGFHCLVSSGTSSKQLKCETDAQFIGYGSMLTEGFLAVIVILACAAGLGLGVASADGATLLGGEAWTSRYGDWKSLGLPQKVGAFVDGSANFLKALGLGSGFAVALMGVLVASFAATTLDTACRLQRYVIQELAGTFIKREPATAPKPGIALTANPLTWLSNKHGATIFAIVLAGAMAYTPGGPGKGPGTGGLLLWPLFGATNQLLGGLAFLVITFWMWRRRLPIWFVAIPTIFMLILPCWAMLHQLFVQAVGADQGWIAMRSWHLVFIAFATIALEAWMIFEAFAAWPKAKGVLEPAVEPLPVVPGVENEGGRSC
jgi:carbon starvation protein